MFELQYDEGDEERVKMNLIELAMKQETLKRTETKNEVKFERNNKMNWRNKKILVTGSSGMIAKELIKLLEEKKAIVYKVDLSLGMDLKHYNNCKLFIKNSEAEYIFHLAGIKGNPKMTNERPADFMRMLQFDINMIFAAQEDNVYNKVKRFLYTSSIAVENPKSDFFPAWAKMTAEHLINAMKIQYPKGTKFTIVRPANVYGKEDLSRDNLMVVSSLIKQAKEKGKLILDRKGAEQERDIIHAKDVARGMIQAMEEMPDKPVNLCSGKSTKIKDIAESIAESLDIPIEYTDLNLILGPQKKIMSNPYIETEVSLKDGIGECCK